ncbi:MAG: membrane protein insertase YidC [bacterium]
MEERTLLAIILSLLIIIGYQYFFVPKPSIEPPKKINGVLQPDSNNIHPKKDLSESQDITKENEFIESFQHIDTFQKKRQVELIDIKTDRYRVSLTNKNAWLRGFELIKYQAMPHFITSPLKASFWSQVLNEYKKFFRNKSKNFSHYPNVNLISPAHDEEFYNLKLVDSELDNFGTGTYDMKVINDHKVRFEFIDNQGFQIIKLVEFNDDDYRIKLTIEIKNLTQHVKKKDYYLVWEKIIDESMEKGHRNFIGAGWFLNNKKKQFKISKIKNSIKNNLDIGWISLENNYFTTCIIPIEKDHESIIFKETLSDKLKKLSIGIKYPAKELLPGSSVSDEYIIYMGPKLNEELIKVQDNLKYVINYGFFSFLARPTIFLLKLIYKYLPNYGWAIIILTIITKIIFYPLTEKSFQSMKKMQVIQPKINEIKQKYKNDMVQTNQEVMALYKEYGVNPMGGCLPMLIQIPVFFALYEALLVAIEIRGAPFMLWITDLSAMDPLLITPIIMGITMFFQQKTMSTSIDPRQAKLFTLMPVMFTFFFLGFPSGLVIYWMINNILTIGHQYIVNTISNKSA